MENNETELFKFLTAIKTCNANMLKKVNFPKNIFGYATEGAKYKLRELNNNYLEICEIATTLSELVIPSMIDGKRIVGIGNNACCGNKSITSLEIPNSVTYIGSGAFAHCSNLHHIRLPNKIRSIGDKNYYADKAVFVKDRYDGAFAYCSMENITLPESVEYIGENTFRCCSKLKTVTLPSRITKIERFCFFSCVNLYKIAYSPHIAEIGNGAFYNCRLLKKIDLPQEMKTIGHFAFQNCKNLCEVQLNKDLRFIGISAFRGCKNLSQVIAKNENMKMSECTFDKNTKIIYEREI